MRINGHGHILPEPFQIPRFMKEKKLFWIDEDKKFMRQGDWSRPISGPGFFIKEKIEWMQKHNIDHHLLALGGRKDTAGSPGSPPTQGSWGVDVVECGNPDAFLESINWNALKAGRPSDAVFEVSD